MGQEEIFDHLKGKSESIYIVTYSLMHDFSYRDEIKSKIYHPGGLNSQKKYLEKLFYEDFENP